MSNYQEVINICFIPNITNNIHIREYLGQMHVANLDQKKTTWRMYSRRELKLIERMVLFFMSKVNGQKETIYNYWMALSPIYNLWDEEKWYWVRWSRVHCHFSEKHKLYIGWATVQHLLYYILLSTQFKFINDFNVRLGKLSL